MTGFNLIPGLPPVRAFLTNLDHPFYEFIDLRIVNDCIGFAHGLPDILFLKHHGFQNRDPGRHRNRNAVMAYFRRRRGHRPGCFRISQIDQSPAVNKNLTADLFGDCFSIIGNGSAVRRVNAFL